MLLTIGAALVLIRYSDKDAGFPTHHVIVPKPVLKAWTRVRDQGAGEMRILGVAVLVAYLLFEVFIGCALAPLIFGRFTAATVFWSMLVGSTAMLGMCLFAYAADTVYLTQHHSTFHDTEEDDDCGCPAFNACCTYLCTRCGRCASITCAACLRVVAQASKPYADESNEFPLEVIKTTGGKDGASVPAAAAGAKTVGPTSAAMAEKGT